MKTNTNKNEKGLNEMKKLTGFLSAALLSIALVACGQSEEPAGEKETETAGGQEQEIVELVIGASNVPHSEILEEAAPLLLEEGIRLKVFRFQDYVLPNKNLADGELDANYFQHIPYLTAQNEQHGYGFVNAGEIHIEPIGVYSQKYATLDELPEGAEILLSSSIPDHGRILAMLEEKGLITLSEGVGITATLEDIVDNPKNFKFNDRVDASFLAQAYLNGEGDAVLINSNYALDAGISPGQDAIALETSDITNPYVNVVAVRSGDETRPEIQKLVEVLTSDVIRQFILEKWNGDVVPAQK